MSPLSLPLLSLRRVSLIAVDCVQPDRAVRALLHCQKQARFRNTFLFTHERISLPPSSGITRVPISRLATLEAYSEFMLWDFPVYRRLFAPHILVVQYDGFIIDPKA